MGFVAGGFPMVGGIGLYTTTTTPAFTSGVVLRIDLPRVTNGDQLEGTDIKPTHLRLYNGTGTTYVRFDANASNLVHDAVFSTAELILKIPTGSNYFTLYNVNATPVVYLAFGKAS